jgi:hypothetical protein
LMTCLHGDVFAFVRYSLVLSDLGNVGLIDKSKE